MEALETLKIARECMNLENKDFAHLDGTWYGDTIVIEAIADEATYLVEVCTEELLDEFYGCDSQTVMEFVKEDEEWKHDKAFLRGQFFDNLETLTVILP